MVSLARSNQDATSSIASSVNFDQGNTPHRITLGSKNISLARSGIKNNMLIKIFWTEKSDTEQSKQKYNVSVLKRYFVCSLHSEMFIHSYLLVKAIGISIFFCWSIEIKFFYISRFVQLNGTWKRNQKLNLWLKCNENKKHLNKKVRQRSNYNSPSPHTTTLGCRSRYLLECGMR